MIYKRCPNCSEKIPYKYVKEYKNSEEIQCPYCCTTLVISFPIIMINSIIIGGAFGVFLAMFTNLSVFWVVIMASVFGLLFQWLFDLLFTLSPKDEDIW